MDTEQTTSLPCSPPEDSDGELDPELIEKIIPEKILEALRQDQVIKPTIEEQAIRTRNNAKKRTRECEVCAENASKYCCPACCIRTCSLECVNRHKKENNCSGKKSRPFYMVPEMDDSILREDYFFLKEVERLAGDSFRASSRKSQKERKKQLIAKGKREDKEEQNKSDKEGNEESKKIQSTLPVALRKLVAEANARGVTLRIMPRGMTRRRVNSSFYAYRSKRFLWRIEWIMNEHLEADKQVKLVSDRVDDGTILQEPLQNIFVSINATTNSGEESTFSVNERRTLREKCEKYLSTPPNELCFLLSTLNAPSTQTVYHQLDPNMSLAMNLSGKTILEYPTLLVVHLEHIHLYNIV